MKKRCCITAKIYITQSITTEEHFPTQTRTTKGNYGMKPFTEPTEESGRSYSTLISARLSCTKAKYLHSKRKMMFFFVKGKNIRFPTHMYPRYMVLFIQHNFSGRNPFQPQQEGDSVFLNFYQQLLCFRLKVITF